MPRSKPPVLLDQEICRLICPISAGMVGVCLTGIGLIRVIITVRHRNTLADDLLAFDALGFLVATLASYAALRTPHLRRLNLVERVADVSFIVSMIVLAATGLYITYAITLA